MEAAFSVYRKIETAPEVALHGRVSTKSHIVDLMLDLVPMNARRFARRHRTERWFTIDMKLGSAVNSGGRSSRPNTWPCSGGWSRSMSRWAMTLPGAGCVSAWPPAQTTSFFIVERDFAEVERELLMPLVTTRDIASGNVCWSRTTCHQSVRR